MSAPTFSQQLAAGLLLPYLCNEDEAQPGNEELMRHMDAAAQELQRKRPDVSEALRHLAGAVTAAGLTEADERQPAAHHQRERLRAVLYTALALLAQQEGEQ